MKPVIEFNEVYKTYQNAGARKTVIDDLSFTIFEGEYVCIVGRSGAGKSTCVNLMLGLIQPSAGSISVLGIDPSRDFNALRKRLACIFQSDRLLPWRNAVDNVRLPLEIIGIDEGALPFDANDWLNRLGLSDSALAYPHQLSGGMRQRVAIARALISDPDIVLADESFASLDVVTGAQLRKDFRALVRRNGRTVVHITHSISEAVELADRIVVLDRPGRLLDVLTVDASRRTQADYAEQLQRHVIGKLKGQSAELIATPP